MDRLLVYLLTYRTPLGRNYPCWEKWASGRVTDLWPLFSWLARADRNTRQGNSGMTIIFDPGSDVPEGPYEPEPAVDVVTIADELFHSFASDLTRLRRRIQAGEVEELKDSVKLVRDLRAATQLVLEERNRVDKLRKDIAGNVGAGALDLDAARDEIGRRLACLRRAR